MKLHQLLRRHFWVVMVNLVSVAAFLHARGLDTLLGSRLSPSKVALAGLPRFAPADHAPLDAPRDLRAATVAARNAFDSVTGPLREQADETFSDDSAVVRGSDDPTKAPQCDGVRVVAIAASSDPDWSLASFLTTEAASPVLRRRGGGVAGRTVTFIGWDRVWLTNERGLCQAAMWMPPRPPAAIAGVVAEKVTPMSATMEDLARGIRRVGPRTFDLDKGVVEKMVEHQAALFAGAQLTPGAGGDSRFRVSGLKPASLLARIGIENGDRLESINGFDLTSPERALEAYARLGQWQHILLTVNRNGAATNLDYDIDP